MAWKVQGLNTGRGKKFFSSSKFPDRFWGQLSLLFNGYRGSFQVVKWQWPDVDLSLPPRAEVKNEWSDTPLICLHGVDRGKFNIFLLKLILSKYEIVDWIYLRIESNGGFFNT
jgi:hypothetical protein